MIRTDQTSLAPPPLPPRLGRSQPILIPAQLPPPGYNNKPLIHFLAGVVMLHLVLSVGGFIFLFYKDKTLLPDSPSAEGRVGYPPTKQEASPVVLARMVIEKQSPEKEEKKKEYKPSGYLQWDKNHSVRKNINSYENGWLTILEPGDYNVYSRVTFSKANPKLPLASRVMLRKSETAEEEIVMKAYCSLNGGSSKSANADHMCTATQMELLTLEKGNQLSVWVQDLSLVDYEEGATTFGMYKL